MDEPFDEMGPPPIRRNNNSNGSNKSGNKDDRYYQQKSSSLSSRGSTTTDSSPQLSRSLLSASISGVPPPSAAFHQNIPDRWAQYEQDGAALQQESAAASARAIAAAAERAAHREPPRKPLFQDDHEENDHAWTTGRQRKPYRDEPDELDEDEIQRKLDEEFLSRPQELYKTSSLPSTKDHPRRRHSPSPSPSRVARSTSFEDVTFEEEDDIRAPRDVRAEALKVLELAEFAEERITSSRQASALSSGFSFKSKRTPAALSGVDWSSAPRRSVINNNKAMTAQNVHDLLDVDRIETRAASSRPAAEDYMDDNDENMGTTAASTSNTTSWSSRYSVDHTLLALSGGKFSASTLLDDMDKEQERIVKSARNMFSTSPHDLKGSTNSTTSPSRGLRGFSFKQQKPPPPIDFNLQSHRTVWTDLDVNGLSLQPAPSRLSWQEQLERKKRRRRQCLRLTLLMTILIIVLSILLGIRHRWETHASASNSQSNEGIDQTLSFYVTSNVPYTSNANVLVFRDELVQLSPDTTPFVVHLGNIQNSAATLCSPVTYLAAKSLLLTSPVPVLTLPGEHDWNNCPFPAQSWQTWQRFFTKMEDNYSHNFTISRPESRPENFALVQKNVLILGLHLVGGRVDDTAEWHRRHVDDVQFVKDQVSQNGNVRAVILLGNARPCPQTSEFFSEIKSTLKSLNKPVAYIHANSGADEVQRYTPFSDVSNVIAFQAPVGGESPLLHVTVGFGNTPIQVA